MYAKQRQQRRRLSRINAVKNIDYEAATSPSSSSSIEDHQASRSLEYSPLSSRTSFRIEGIDGGEFERICRSLGLSGPEDFAIPADAWEAHKSSSPIKTPLLCTNYHDDDKFDNGNDCLSSSARVCDDAKDKLNYASDCRLVKDSLCVAKVGARVFGVSEEVVPNRIGNVNSDGGGGIKGLRPPPVISRKNVIDDKSSTWDIFRSFGPEGDNGVISMIREVDEVEDEEEEDVAADGGFAEERELIEERLGDSAGIVTTESFSDSSNDDDSFGVAAIEHDFSISPNGSYRVTIKSWQKGGFLGSGSFGTVFEAYDEYGFFFAVKEVSLLDSGSQGQQSIYQLEQEISLLSQFHHENIVRYLGTDKDDSKLYIFLELVTKGSLASLYQKYRLGDSHVSSYTRQILNGLNYLHSRNVVHRDIKCANILVDASGSVKLADFGLAKATKLNDIKSCKGTAFWMAPEVVRNRGYGLAADIWSLGCTVLEMLTGKIPYSHLEGMQAIFRIGRGEPPHIPNTLSADAQEFILKCLQVNPDDRPTAAQLLDHPFVRKLPSTFPSPISPHCRGV